MPPSKGQGPGQIKIQFPFIVRLGVVLKPASLRGGPHPLMKLPVLAWNGAVWWAPAETQSRGGPAVAAGLQGGHATYSVFKSDPHGCS